MFRIKLEGSALCVLLILLSLVKRVKINFIFFMELFFNIHHSIFFMKKSINLYLCLKLEIFQFEFCKIRCMKSNTRVNTFL